MSYHHTHEDEGKSKDQTVREIDQHFDDLVGDVRDRSDLRKQQS